MSTNVPGIVSGRADAALEDLSEETREIVAYYDALAPTYDANPPPEATAPPPLGSSPPRREPNLPRRNRAVRASHTTSAPGRRVRPRCDQRGSPCTHSSGPAMSRMPAEGSRSCDRSARSGSRGQSPAPAGKACGSSCSDCPRSTPCASCAASGWPPCSRGTTCTDDHRSGSRAASRTRRDSPGCAGRDSSYMSSRPSHNTRSRGGLPGKRTCASDRRAGEPRRQAARVGAHSTS